MIPAQRLKIEQQLDGRYRLVRTYRARRSDDIIAVYQTREEAQHARARILNARDPEPTTHPNPWEDW